MQGNAVHVPVRVVVYVNSRGFLLVFLFREEQHPDSVRLQYSC